MAKKKNSERRRVTATVPKPPAKPSGPSRADLHRARLRIDVASDARFEALKAVNKAKAQDERLKREAMLQVAVPAYEEARKALNDAIADLDRLKSQARVAAGTARVASDGNSRNWRASA